MDGAQSRPLRIVFLDRETLSPETHLRPPAFSHELILYDRTEPGEVAERIADADIVIVNKSIVSAASIATASRLQLIAAAATGTDNIDVQAAAGRGIVVSNIRNYAGETVPEHTFGLILLLRRVLDLIQRRPRGWVEGSSGFMPCPFPLWTAKVAVAVKRPIPGHASFGPPWGPRIPPTGRRQRFGHGSMLPPRAGSVPLEPANVSRLCEWARRTRWTRAI
jgi:glycerate dehydrogenase